jgi:hypothetical protein
VTAKPIGSAPSALSTSSRRRAPIRSAWRPSSRDGGPAARYPDDHEIQIFQALAILAVAYNSPPDKTYSMQKRAAEILNGVLPRHRDHPGVAHYMIHSFDYPELAPLAL